MSILSWRLVAGITAGLAVVALLEARDAGAQNSGDLVRFLVPSNTVIVLGPTGDSLIFIARPAGTTNARDCVNDDEQRPIQTAMVLDPGSGQRPTRISGVVVTSQMAPVHNGTKLENLQHVTDCFLESNSTLNTIYEGTVR